MRFSSSILRTAAKYTILALLLFFLGRHVWGQWEAVENVRAPDFHWIAYGAVAAIMALSTVASGCQFLIRSHGFNISYPNTLGLCFVPLLGKYIPGKVWSIVAALHLYGRQGIPKRVAATCLTLLMALSLASAALVTLLLGLTLGGPKGLFGPCVAVVALLIVGLYPPIFYRTANCALQAFGRNRIESTVSLAGILRVLLILIVAKLAYGTGFFLLIQSFHRTPWENLPAVIALFTFAQIAGLVAVFAPAGIGIREGVLLLGLQPLVGPGPAIVITGACRLWQTAIELVMAGIGWLALRSNDGKTRSFDTRSGVPQAECSLPSGEHIESGAADPAQSDSRNTRTLQI